MEVITLDNGLRVLLLPFAEARSVSAGVWIEAGSRFERAEEQGVSHFVEHILFKGTAARSARAISEEMDRLGGSLNAYTAQDCTCYYAQSLPESAPGVLDILSDMLLHAAVADRDVELERQVILDEIAMYEDVGEDLAHEALCAGVWRDSPLGRPICGTRRTVASLSPAALRRAIAGTYTPERMVAAVAGRFDREGVLEVIGAGLGALPCGGGRPEIDRPAFHAGVFLRKKRFEQVSLELAFPGIPAGDDRRYAMMLLNFAVGGGASSRLFLRLREELGLAYSIYSSAAAEQGAGLFLVSAAVAPARQEQALAEIRAVLQETAAGLTQDEIARARAQVKASTILGMESVAARASAAARSLLLHGRVIGEDEVLAGLDAVTGEEIARLAEEIFTGPAALAAAGPVKGEGFYRAFL